jgi:hypothetical protein
MKEFSIKVHDQDIRAHRLIDGINLLERRLSDAIKQGNSTQAVKLQRRIMVIDRQAWKLSSDPLLGGDDE